MATKYLLPCSCGQKHPVEATQAGQVLQCRCGQPILVPTMQQLRGLESEEHVERLPQSAQASLAHRLLLLGGLVMLVGAGLSVWVHWTRPRWLPFDWLSPVESLTVWRLYTHSPHIQLSPTEKQFRIACQRNSRWLAVTLTIAAIGAVVFGAGLLVVGHGSRRVPPDSG